MHVFINNMLNIFIFNTIFNMIMAHSLSKKKKYARIAN